MIIIINLNSRIQLVNVNNNVSCLIAVNSGVQRRKKG